MLDITVQSFSVKDTVLATVEVIRTTADKTGLVLEVEIDSELPPFLEGDEGRVRQVMLNLLSNAVKFTEQGEVRVRVKCQFVQNGQARLGITVIDTGIGIANDKLGGVFGKFTQAEATTTRRFGGTGLGLSISKQLIELMDEAIGVESETGVGSTFWFELSLAVGEKPGHLEADDRDTPKHRAARILVVEHNAQGPADHCHDRQCNGGRASPMSRIGHE